SGGGAAWGGEVGWGSGGGWIPLPPAVSAVNGKCPPKLPGRLPLRSISAGGCGLIDAATIASSSRCSAAEGWNTSRKSLPSSSAYLGGSSAKRHWTGVIVGSCSFSAS